jgi:RNA polymerase sigma-B factor
MSGHAEAIEQPCDRARTDQPGTLVPTVADETARLLEEASAAADPDQRREALEAVVVLNMPLARAIAGRYQNRGVPRDDLEQVAFLALTRAAQEFDPTYSRPFHSYAVPCIRGSVKKYFRDQAWSVRPPRRVQELQAQIAGARSELEQKLGRSPRVGEVAAHLGSTLDDVVDALSADGCYAPISLDAPASADGHHSVGDWLAADDADDAAAAAEARLLLAPVVRRLDERDRCILEMRFFQGCTQQEIADRIGVTQMHVSRLLSRALAKIREGLEEPETAHDPPARGHAVPA